MKHIYVFLLCISFTAWLPAQEPAQAIDDQETSAEVTKVCQQETTCNLVVTNTAIIQGTLNVGGNATIKGSLIANGKNISDAVTNGANLGSGQGVFANKSGSILDFQSLVAGS